MADRDTSLSHKTFPWFRSGFDLEGVVGFLAAWLLGILLAMVWEPLFWLAFIPGILILFATRTVERVTPQTEEHVVTPCDGVVVSMVETEAPAALRMAGPAIRIRISSSPFVANNIHAPIAGAIDRIEREEGDPKSFAAMKAETEGLERLSMVFSSDVLRTGFVLATGALGPRLDVKADAGDRILKGKTVATRRLGGWCDVYVPARSPGAAVVEPGRTLVGGETILWDLHMNAAEAPFEPSRDDLREPEPAAPQYSDLEPAAPAVAATAVTPDPMPPEVASGETTGAAETTGFSGIDPVEPQPTPEVVPPSVEEEVETEIGGLAPESEQPPITDNLPPDVAEETAHPGSDGTPSSASPEEDSDPASMFERLRQQARRLAGDEDDDSENR